MKYELIELTTEHEFYGTGVNYQVRALKDSNSVKKGDLGGYVNNADNLSQEGDCWLYGNSRIFNNSAMSGNSRMYDNSRMYGNSIMDNRSELYGEIFGNIKLKTQSQIKEIANLLFPEED